MQYPFLSIEELNWRLFLLTYMYSPKLSTAKKQNVPQKISLCFQVNSIIDKVQVVEPEWLAKTLDDQHQMEMSKWKINILVYFILLSKPVFWGYIIDRHSSI